MSYPRYRMPESEEERVKETIIKAVQVCKSFSHNGNQNHVLDMIDLDIYAQDFTVIMGSSGAGKSTLLYALSAMDRITSGNVIYKDKEISTMKERELAQLRAEEFGFVFQQTHLVSNLSLFENVIVPGYLDTHRSAKQVRKRAVQLLQKMHIEKAAERLPFQVSGGEAQRAAIARAMINEPAVLFADEPTGALNKRNSEKVLKLLSTLHEEGQSIVLVTHDIRTAVYANRLLYLEDGKILDEMTLPPYREQDSRSRELAYVSGMVRG